MQSSTKQKKDYKKGEKQKHKGKNNYKEKES